MMTGCPSDFQVGAHDAALTRPTERALRALAPSRAAVRPARAPTPIRAPTGYRARRVVDVREEVSDGYVAARRFSNRLFFALGVECKCAPARRPRRSSAPAPVLARPRQILKSFVRALHPHARPVVVARRRPQTPRHAARAGLRRSVPRATAARASPPPVASGGRKRVRSLPRRVVLSSALADGSEAKPRGRASPSVRVVTRARHPRVRRSISTCPPPGAPTGDFPSRVSPTAPRLM